MLVIGELINGMYKKISKAIKEKDKSSIQRIAQLQVEAGADALDLNCGASSLDMIEDLKWLVETVQEKTDVALVLDSTKPQAIKEALKITKQKAIINSTSADDEKLNTLVELAKQTNSSLIALTLDKKGVPQDKERRIELAAKIITFCQEKDFSLEELYIDPVVLPVNVAQMQAKLVIETLREIKLLSSPAPKTILGLSNISQGSLNRKLINRTFLVMALDAGLDAVILDPLDKELMDSLITAELLLNKHIYCDSYLDAYRKR
jgi:5-methyltetrahydrofolate corrinoid/iron sulfur protein methyltransferase